MKLTSDDDDFVELEPRWKAGDSDLALIARVSRNGFAGESETRVLRHGWFAFAQALTVLEEQRAGEASVESMSHGELALTIRSVDRTGHPGVENPTNVREFDHEISLRFSLFTFEPNQIMHFAQGARRISEMLGSRGR